MRLKHVKGAEEKVLNSPYVINGDNLKEVFKNKRPIHIEIGMGKGNFIINMALKYPKINFIGIEKQSSVLIRALEKLEKCPDNLRFMCMDANKIDEVFKNNIDLIYLNFSDPWPKVRHEKRRLTSPNFLEKYEKICKSKHIIMKTDNRSLFEYSIRSFVDFGYKIKEVHLDLHKDNIEDNIPTEYEIKFSSKGFPIYKIEVYK